MSYLHVRNWEKHQHRDLAGKGNMPWFKVDTGLFDDPKLIGLGDVAFMNYIRCLTLAAKTGNKIPSEIYWLRSTFGRNWRRDLQRLIDRDLIEGDLPQKYGRGGRPKRSPQPPPVLSEYSASTQLAARLSTNGVLAEYSKTAYAGETAENAAPAPRLEEKREEKLGPNSGPNGPQLDAHARDNNAAHSGSSGNVMDGFMRVMEERAARNAESSFARLADEDAAPP